MEKHKFIGFTIIYISELFVALSLQQITIYFYNKFFPEISFFAGQVIFWCLYSLFTEKYLVKRVYKLDGD